MDFARSFCGLLLFVLLTGYTVVRVVSVPASGVQSDPVWPPVQLCASGSEVTHIFIPSLFFLDDMFTEV